MKLKSAHIFLAAASLATLTVLAGCGSNTSGDLTSPGYAPGQLFNRGQSVLSVQISPRSASAHVGQVTQLQVNGGLDNGQTADVTDLVTWSSSDPSMASVDGNGRVRATGKVVGNALTGGTVTITATAGPVSDSIQFTVNAPTNKVFISNKTGNSIGVFDIAATGSVTAGHKIAGASTNLSAPVQIAFSLARQELFVANSANNEIEVFYLQAEGNVAPLRHIKSAATTGVTGVAINPTTNEVFALAGGQISVYDIAASGDAVVPKRIVAGATTTLGTVADSQLSLDNVNNNIIVPNGTTVLTFPQNASGNVAPSNTLLGPLAPVLPATTPVVFSKITSVANDGTNMFLTDQNATPTSVMKYPVGASANSVPTITLNDGFAAPAGLLPVPGSGNLWVVDAAKVSLYGAALTPASIVRSFTSADLAGAAGIVITQSF